MILLKTIQQLKILGNYFLILQIILLACMLFICRSTVEFSWTWLGFRIVGRKISKTVKKLKSIKIIKRTVRGTLLTSYIEIRTKLLRYLNLTINNAAYGHIFLSSKPRRDYINDSLIILNLKWRFFVTI